MPRMSKNQSRLDIAVGRDTMKVCKMLHEGYKGKYGSNISFASYIERMIKGYIQYSSEVAGLREFMKGK